MDSLRKTRLRNEFSSVELTINTDGFPDDDPTGRVSLTVRDLENNMEITLDVLELESLTRMSHAQFGPLIVDHFPDPESDNAKMDRST